MARSKKQLPFKVTPEFPTAGLLGEFEDGRRYRIDLFCTDTHRPEFHHSETYHALEDEEPSRGVVGSLDDDIPSGQEDISEGMLYRSGIDPDATLGASSGEEEDESETLQAYLARLAEEAKEERCRMAEEIAEAAQQQAEDAERRRQEAYERDLALTAVLLEEREKESLPSQGTRLMIRRHRGRRAKELRLIERIAA